jgi:hypothetical protein
MSIRVSHILCRPELSSDIISITASSELNIK